METAERRIERSWFSASPYSTTAGFLIGDHQTRIAPLGESERALGWMVLPSFQRPPVWAEQQKVRFVESCWLGLPVGVFIINRPDNMNSPYYNWLLDGQQRVTALYEYMADEFAVLGYKFSELTNADLRQWHMGVHFGHLETHLEDEAALRDVYERLAYGGTPHERDSDTRPKDGDAKQAPLASSAALALAKDASHDPQ